MFDELPATGLLEKLSALIYRWRGIDAWPTATATVFNCEYHGGRGGQYFEVSFSYRAAGEIREG